MVYCIIGICKNIAGIQRTNDEHGVFQNMIKVDLQHIMKSQMGLEANLNQRSLFLEVTDLGMLRFDEFFRTRPMSSTPCMEAPTIPLS